MSLLVNIILIVLVFGVIVCFHELGHFLMAKANKIAVTEFSIGMGPKLFSFVKNETRYSIRILPLGGYCMMVGEDEDVDDENSFGNKPLLARILVVAAGPVFNFILAVIFGAILVHFAGCDPATLSYVEKGSAAAEAGLEEGDTIKEINGSNVYNYREVVLSVQLENDGEPIEMLVEKADGKTYKTVVNPKKDASGNYKLGVMGGYIVSESIASDIKYGFLECRYWMKATLMSLKMIVTGGVSSDDVMGPVGVGGAMNDVIEEAKDISESKLEAVANVALNLLNWCILLSVNLGVMNLLPIPALDGGRLLFLFVEAVRRKKIPTDKEAVVNLIGFCLMILLMIVVFFNDIKNVFF